MPVKILKKCNALNQNYIKVKISDNFHLTIIILTKFVLARSMMFCNITCFYKNKGNYSGLAFHSSRFKVSSRSTALLGNVVTTFRIIVLQVKSLFFFGKKNLQTRSHQETIKGTKKDYNDHFFVFVCFVLSVFFAALLR